ncbi:MAG TPA: PBP1A family penicillin-binding protein [Patescibacteria group bacterium]|nr:PBP1A family penicillin-binding protein [Patescibacteria group bacterium]
MRIRIRFDRKFWTSRAGLAIAGTLVAALLVSTGIFLIYWFRFERMLDQRFNRPVFGQSSELLSAPAKIEIGQVITPQQLVTYLQRAGYTDQPDAALPGWYQAAGSSVEIHPSKDSYFGATNDLRVDFAGGKVAAVVSLDNGQTVPQGQLEPVVLTNLFGTSRVKRQVVPYGDLPPTLIHAVLAAEDRWFFQEPGVDPVRIVEAAWTDLLLGRKAQGASTITMQVARSFFFTRARTFRRKIEETLMAFELEHRFTKQQIFDLYANQVYLGNRGSFSIHGFGAAAQAYFGQNLPDLNLAQDAFLAGIIRAPNHYAISDEYPSRAVEARDRVLQSMVNDGFISRAQQAAARQIPLTVVPAAVSTSNASYFVDLVRNQLLEHFSQTDLKTQSYRIYTTLDPELQSAAQQAVADGMKLVDQRLARRYAKWKREGKPVPHPQVALVAVDPQTGEVRALVGGRDYAQSQFDHVLAQRQPGSVFKPFVYAAAFLTALDGQQPVITPVTTVVDEPTTFQFDGTQYTPDNYEQRFFGVVTAREALTHSLNVATVKIARMVGYDRILQLARQMKLDDQIQATPAMALGSYDMTPMDVAAGYTAFANGGVRAEPVLIRSVLRNDGSVAEQVLPQSSPVLDPRVAFLVTSVMENVLNHGTGVVARQMGFNAPAAGKTGTSHDGWFGGFTSKLECIVWVGFDDNRELGLAGANSAGPIWAEFMKSALSIPGYDNPQPFTPPPGVVEESIDPASLELASANCPNPQDDYFITGTQPTEYSGGMHMPPPISWMAHVLGGGNNPPPPTATPGKLMAPSVSTRLQETPARPSTGAPAPSKREKKGFLQRLFGIFGGQRKSAAHPPPSP